MSDIIYTQYKTAQSEAFKIIHTGKDTSSWSLRQLEKESGERIPNLEQSERSKVTDLLKRTILLRIECSHFFTFAPAYENKAHTIFLLTLIRILARMGPLDNEIVEQIGGTDDNIVPLVSPRSNATESTTVLKSPATDDLHSAAAPSLIAYEPSSDADTLTMEEADFLDLLCIIQGRVSQAVSLWKAVISERNTMPLRVVSLATNTHLNEVKIIAGFGKLLFPSFFTENPKLRTRSTYWEDLVKFQSDEAVEHAFNIFAKAAVNCRISAKQAHTPYRFLGLDSEEPHTKGKRPPLHVAIALQYADQVQRIYATQSTVMSHFRREVENDILTAETLFQEEKNIWGCGPKYAEGSMTLEQAKSCVQQAQDIFTLGFMAETVECLRISCITGLLIHPLFRSFACIYERMRLEEHISDEYTSGGHTSDTCVAILERFLQDPVIGSLVLVDGRPVSPEAWQKLFEKTFKKKGMKKFLPYSFARRDFFHKNVLFLRLRAQFARNIDERSNSIYRLTRDLHQKMDGNCLEECLKQENIRFTYWSDIWRRLLKIILNLKGEQSPVSELTEWFQSYVLTPDKKKVDEQNISKVINHKLWGSLEAPSTVQS